MKDSEWADLIAECHTSGISIKLWCQNHGITYRSYRYWVKKLENKQQWAQVPVIAVSDSVVNNKINLQCGKWRVTVDSGISMQLLTDVLRVVNEICC